MKLTDNFLGFIACIICVILWGGTFVIREGITKISTGYDIVFLQTLIGFFVLLGYNLIKKINIKIGGKLILIHCALGIFGIAGYQSGVNNSMAYLSPAMASILVGLAPIFIYITDVILKNEKLTALGVFSLGISLVGIYFLSTDSSLTFEIEGILFCLFAIGSWLIYCLAVRKYSKNNVPLTVSLMYQSLSSFIIVAVLVNVDNVKFILTTETFIFSILYLAIINCVIANLLFLYAMNKIGIIISNLMNNFIPISTIAISMVILDYKVSFGEIMGIIFIISSVVLMNVSINKSKVNKIKENEYAG